MKQKTISSESKQNSEVHRVNTGGKQKQWLFPELKQSTQKATGTQQASPSAQR